MPLANISTGSTGVQPVATPQINIMDVLQSNRAMNQALLDNIQLHEALADELGVSNKRVDAEKSGYDLQTQQNKAASGLLPSEVQAKQAGLDRTIAITPAQTAVDLGDLSTQAALQPGNQQIGLTAQDITRAGQAAQQPADQFLAGEMQQDPSGGMTKTRQMYESLFGAPLKDDSGSVNYSGMQQMNNAVAEAKLRAMMMQMNSPLTKDLFDAARAKNRLDLVFNANGTIRSPADIANDLQNLPTPVSPEDAQKAASDYNVLNEGLKKLNDLKSIINDPAHDVVGPRIGQGDFVGQGLAKGQAWLGGDQTKLAEQQKVEQARAQQLGDMMKQFSGIRNQKEFNALGDRIPSLGNNKDNWNSYIDDATKLTKQTMDSIKSGIPAGVSVSTPFAQQPAAQSTAQQPAANINSLPLVTSQQQYDSLPSGTRFRNSAGETGTKP